ncbi:NKG2-D type II integral membrane protein-like [Ochotona curzoniae]|uniref:NKG2-D type II integral membrane protein-like n=1 Tax=Ochotona curzoniae TaxID=130825 RepID=UPI001B353BAA|nr:NKG2-D type II integral membrane protein-like [Ochotona curzoniae]XP_040834645.1 NKG2-D type II integral membrane protein-like [Ochotona curzoniae]
MELMHDSKTQHAWEMTEFHNCHTDLAKRKVSKQRPKQRAAPITRRQRKTPLPVLLAWFVAVAMGLRFIVMVTMWSTIVKNSLLNQEVPISFNGDYSGPCPQDWMFYRNNCYWFSNESKSWKQSQASCMSKNSSLLKIYSRVDQDFFKLVKSYHWLGLTQTPTNGSWHWEDGSMVSPDILRIVTMCNSSCVVYGSSFKGYTEDCSAANTYICMRRIA